MGTPPPCLQPSFRNRPNPKKVGYPVRVIKDMKSVNGKRTWLIGWEGEDENGDAWADSWEPSSFVSQDLMDAFLTDTAGRKDRVIEVDTRPLDNLVQKRIDMLPSLLTTDLCSLRGNVDRLVRLRPLLFPFLFPRVLLLPPGVLPLLLLPPGLLLLRFLLRLSHIHTVLFRNKHLP